MEAGQCMNTTQAKGAAMVELPKPRKVHTGSCNCERRSPQCLREIRIILSQADNACAKGESGGPACQERFASQGLATAL